MRYQRISSSKIEEVGGARRSMSAVERFTEPLSANPLLTLIPQSVFIPFSRKRRLPPLRWAQANAVIILCLCSYVENKFCHERQHRG